MTLSRISVELNDCPAKVLLEESKDRLWVIIDGEGYEINHNNRLVKKK
jgi:cytochrome b involved in lipid metabolism